MKSVFMAIGAAALLAVPASAQTYGSSSSSSTEPSAKSSSSQSPSDKSSSSQSSSDKSSQSQATQSPSMPGGSTSDTSSATASNSSSSQGELSGVLKKVDEGSRSLTIEPTAGGSAKDLKVAKSATITRDGSTASLDQLKKGDDIRASFDASTNQATELKVQSKEKMEKSQDKK
jgi:Cu/Ag efflux protein CusF